MILGHLPSFLFRPRQRLDAPLLFPRRDVLPFAFDQAVARFSIRVGFRVAGNLSIPLPLTWTPMRPPESTLSFRPTVSRKSRSPLEKSAFTPISSVIFHREASIPVTWNDRRRNALVRRKGVEREKARETRKKSSFSREITSRAYTRG